MRLKALIFDVDGTLADTEEAHRGAFNAAFRDQGLAWHWSRPEYARLLVTTGGKERLAAFIASLSSSADEKRALCERIPAIHRAKTEHYTRLIGEGVVSLRPGVSRILDEAGRCGVRLGIASTTTVSNVEALLTANLGADALGRFAVIGAGDQVLRKKPAPDIYEWVLQQLDLGAGDCVAVEDSENGLRAAKSAGIHTIVTPSYWTRCEDFAAADRVLSSLEPPFAIRDIDAGLSRGGSLAQARHRLDIGSTKAGGNL